MAIPTDIVLERPLPAPARSASRTWWDRLRQGLVARRGALAPAVWVTALLGRLQPVTAARFGAALGDLAWRFGIRRRVAAANLALVSDAAGPVRRRLGRRCYRTMGANFVEIWSRDRAALKAKVELLNPEWTARLQRRQGGRVIWLGCHLGQWDLTPVPFADRDVSGRLPVFAKALRCPTLTACLNRQRRALGMEIIDVGGDACRALKAGLDRLRAGRAVGIMADQGPRPSRGWPVHLFGQRTFVHPGPALLARKTGAVVVPVTCLRRSSSVTAVLVGRPVEFAGLDDAAAADRLARTLETMIARHPGQYFWQHRRFKYRW